MAVSRGVRAFSVGPAGGFSVVELLLASVLLAVLSSGVYALYRDALRAESRSTIRLNRRARARAVVNHFRETLEQIVNVGEIPALAAGPTRDGGYELECTVCGSDGGIERRKYTFIAPGDEEEPSAIELRMMYYAGTKNLGPPGGAAEPWSFLEPKVIAKGVGVSFSFKTLGSDWVDSFSGQEGTTYIRIKVDVGEESVQGAVISRVNAPLIDREEG